MIPSAVKQLNGGPQCLSQVRIRPDSRLAKLPSLGLLLASVLLLSCSSSAPGDTINAAGEGLTAPRGELSPRLGIVEGGVGRALKNGGKVIVSDGVEAEVFLTPYPPDWHTDLHLFLAKKESFEPVTDVDVSLDYEMTYMDHGIDAQRGTKVKEGHYVMPLNFLMYGDWTVDLRLTDPKGNKKHIQLQVKFFP